MDEKRKKISIIDVVEIPEIKGWLSDGLFEIKCPSCGSNWDNDLKEAKLHRGNDNYEAWEGRGDLATITLRCAACRDNFDICLGFHKGKTYLYVRF
jgi:hypothetical protein